MNAKPKMRAPGLSYLLHSKGMSLTDEQVKIYADIYRKMMTLGLNDDQAFNMLRILYSAHQGYVWQLDKNDHSDPCPGLWGLYYSSLVRDAKEHPNGKSAAKLAEWAAQTH